MARFSFGFYLAAVLLLMLAGALPLSVAAPLTLLVATCHGALAWCGE